MTRYVLTGLAGGLLVGLLIGGYAQGILYGGLIGGLAGWVLHLSRRLKELEATRATAASTGHHPQPDPADDDPEATPPSVTTAVEDVSAADTPPASDPTWHSHARPKPKDDAPKPRPRSTPSPADRILAAAKDWFTTGNVPAKIGVVVVLFGVGFFIKYAIDHELFSLPVWARLAGLALFGLGMLGMGWRLRAQREIYALSLQGGGLGILYLTTYAAFEFYALLPATVAFGAMVIVTVAAGLLAVLQNARTLIVLGVAGGFLAPVLASTDTGNHVALFSYYAVLNAAILGIAWFKAWRMLNLLGFGFTFVIASLWGYEGYRPEHFATTEPFLILFVLMYIGVAVLFALRRPPNLRGFVDGTVVFGTPFIGFALQTQLVESDTGLAWSAGGLAAVYGVLGGLVWRIADLRLLAMCFVGLALAFLAAAFPLALDDRWTSAAWAMQGAAMAWFGVRNGSPLPARPDGRVGSSLGAQLLRNKLLAFGGAALQVVAAAAHVIAGPFGDAGMPVLNGPFLSGALLALAGWTVAWSFDHGALSARAQAVWTRVMLVWAGAWWFLSVGWETSDLPEEGVRSAWLAAAALSAVAAMLVARALAWGRLASLGLVLLPVMAVVLGSMQSHPLEHYGWLAWPLAFGVQYGFLYAREGGYPRLAPFLQIGTYWVLAWLVAREVHWLVGNAAGGDWPLASAVVSAAVLAWATGRARRSLPWPLETHWHWFSTLGIPVVAGMAALAVLVASLTSSGSAAPLPYLPLLNPLTIAAVVAGVAAWDAYDIDVGRADARGMLVLVVAAGLVLLSMDVARGVHHFVGVPFTAADLAGSAIFQAGLSLVWGAAGLAGMVAGAMRERREVWIGGAVVMGLVIVKLFVVELGNVDTLSRVVSFLGVGLLLLVVGYFAPVPKGGDSGREPA